MIGFFDGSLGRYYRNLFFCFVAGAVLTIAYGCTIAGGGKHQMLLWAPVANVPTTAGDAFFTALFALIIALIVFGYTSPVHAGVIGMASFAVIYSITSGDQARTRLYKSLARTWRVTFALEVFLFLFYWFHTVYFHKGPLINC